MKKKIINGLLLIAALVTISSAFVSCKDSESSDRSSIVSLEDELKKQIDEFKAYVTTAKGELETLKQQLTDLENDLNTKIGNTTVIQNINQQITNILTQIGDADTKITNIENVLGNTADLDGKTVTQWILDLNQEIINIKNLLGNFATTQDLQNLKTELQGKDNELLQKINDLTDRLNTLETKLDDLIVLYNQQMKELYDSAYNVGTRAYFDSIRIDALERLLAQLEGRVSTLEHNPGQGGCTCDLTDVVRRQQLLDSCAKIRASIAQVLTAANAYTDTKVQQVWDEITTINGNITTINGNITTINTTIGEIQTELAKKVDRSEFTTLQNTVTTLSNNLTSLTNTVNNILRVSAEQVTGLEINGTIDPVFGYANLPADVRSNVLAVYWGEALNYVAFPANNDDAEEGEAYFNKELVLNNSDFSMIGSVEKFYADQNDILINENDGNAGKLYLTVNPNTVDFTGKTVSLVNSKGDVLEGMKLSPLQPSSDVLTFGYSRGNANGFYEAQATVSADDVKDASLKLRVDLSSLKGVATNVANKLRGKEALNVTNLALTTLDAVNDVLDAQAVRASYLSLDKDGKEQMSNVVSQYAIAATTIKPLSYNFLHPYESNYKVRGFGRLEQKLDDIIDAINVKVNIPDDAEIDQIVISYDGLQDVYVITITYQEPTQVDPGTGAITAYETRTTTASFEPNLYSKVSSIIDQLNAGLDDMNDILNAVHSFNNQVGDYKTKAKNAIARYLDRAESIINKYINKAKFALQPIMVYLTATGDYALASTKLTDPTVVTGTYTGIFCTSYTLETVAPAFKKFVAVTNVYKAGNTAVNAKAGDAACKAALDAANNTTDFKKVVEGKEGAYMITGWQKGYVYEVAYAALDYTGASVVRKYYFQF